MKRLTLLLLLLCGVVTIDAATIDTLQIRSDKMNRDITTLVIRPKTKAKAKVPTLYLLHGFGGKESSWMRLRDLRPLADKYGMLIVCPDGGSSWYWDSPQRADSQYETFVSKELVEYIDKNYPTIAQRTARAISGFSMGGHGAMWNALRHKDIFGAVGAISGGLDIRPFPERWKMAAQLGKKADNEEVWDNHTAINAIGKLKNGELRMIIDCGVDDFFIDVNRAFHQALVEKKISHDYIERADAHTANYWRNSIIYQVHYVDQYFTEQTALRAQSNAARKTGVATIENDFMKVQISKKGAELMSIVSKDSGREYLWQGDPEYWKFRSPVLFPIIGSVCDNTYRMDGKEYNMTIHGIARDYDFKLVKLNATEAVYRLTSNAEMKAKYPYDFVLEIGYKLTLDDLRVSYKVVNPNNETMYFQLGAHPGFNYRNFDPEAKVQGYYQFADKKAGDKLTINTFSKDGFIAKKKGSITLAEGGVLPLTKSTFNNDALILEGEQTKEISLLDANKEPYVKVKFDAPVVGLWSKGGNLYAPFVCIEPWYGRCDDANYTGEFKDKPWMQSLESKGTFKSSLSIWIAR